MFYYTYLLSFPMNENLPLAGGVYPYSLYRWRQMRHGQFLGGDEKSIFGGNEKV